MPGEQLGNAPLERATELNTESLRHQAAMQGFRTQQQALVEQIPGIIAQARQTMINDLQSAQALNVQEQIAQGQFGLAKQQQGFAQGVTRQQQAQSRQAQAFNERMQQQTVAQNAQRLAIARAQANAAGAKLMAQLKGKTQANGIKWLTGWVQPTKDQMITKTVKGAINPKTGQSGPTQRYQILAPGWHRDVGQALNILMDQYGFTQQQALQAIRDIGGTTIIGGGAGKMTMAQWASTFYQRQRAQQVWNSPGFQRRLVGGVGAAARQALAGGGPPAARKQMRS